MKPTGKWLITLAITTFLSLSGSGFAQTNTNSPSAGAPEGGTRGTVETRLARLSAQLKLTDEQKPKVKAILEEENRKRRELQNDSALSQEDRRSRRSALRDDLGRKMKEVLTTEQHQQYEKLQQEPRGRRNQSGAEPGNRNAGDVGQ
jgi:Spy/CpxP family protein refolding chaperone